MLDKENKISTLWQRGELVRIYSKDDLEKKTQEIEGKHQQKSQQRR